MKKVLILIALILLSVLLSACSGEAKEPVPEWSERLAGEYDASLSFTFGGAGPESSGVDSITGRMTALFPTPDGGTLALGWRRVTGAERELLEDFLSETGGETGVWERDSSAPGALESYVCLGQSWYVLSASGDGLEEAALLRLVDGTVEAHAGEETALPRAASSLWLEELPWEESWTCLMLGIWELEPEAGKEALFTLLNNYHWQLADPAAAEGEFVPALGAAVVPRIRQTSIYRDAASTGEAGPLRFHLRSNGDLYWNGTLRHPLGENAGERLLTEWDALAETGANTESPPRLTVNSGAESMEAILWGSYSWHYTTRIGGGTVGCESDAAWYAEIDWLGEGYPVLEAEAPVKLDFGPYAPDSMSLNVYSAIGSAPLILKDGSFTPLAGLHTYFLHCFWNRSPGEPGGGGSGSYILLIEGAEDLGPEPGNTEDLSLTLLEADAWGCAFTLEKRSEGMLKRIGDLYTLLRRTDAGGWDWVEPIRSPWEGTLFGMTGALSINLAWEWSYAYGVLPPGEYRLLLGWTKNRASNRIFVYTDFTLDEAEPVVPGPLSLCETPEGLECSVERLSPHRWVQTFTPLAECTDGWKIDNDFSLFRLSEDGSFTYIPPAYRLPRGLTECYPLFRKERLLEIDLAAQYGDLEAGTYLLRRRVLRVRPEDQLDLDLWGQYLNWRLFPEERFEYLDTVLILEEPLAAPALEVAPFDSFLYTGEASTFPVDPEGGWCRSAQFHLVLRTPVYADFPYDLVYNPHEYAIYFLEAGEWLPLNRQNDYRLTDRDKVRQEPGTTREHDYFFPSVYDKLEAGTYRLVIPCTADPRKEGLKQEKGVVAVQFRIGENGLGVYYNELPQVSVIASAVNGPRQSVIPVLKPRYAVFPMKGGVQP